MPKVQAIVNVPFGNGTQPKGAVFEASEQEANILVALKRVVRVKVEPAKPEPKPEPEVGTPTQGAPKKAAPAKQTYRTRDLKSKG